MPLIPVDQLVTIPEGVAITPAQLILADLSTIPRNVALLTIVDAFKVFIRKEGQLVVRQQYTVQADTPLAKKYCVKNVANALNRATGLMPLNEAKAATLPRLTSAGWHLPDEVYWEFRLPVTTTGSELLDQVRASGDFFMMATERLLADAGKPLRR